MMLSYKPWALYVIVSFRCTSTSHVTAYSGYINARGGGSGIETFVQTSVSLTTCVVDAYDDGAE